MKQNQVIQRDSQGRILQGSVLNPYGKPPGVMSYGGRKNREIREFLADKFYETVTENWPMIYRNLMELCAEKDSRVLLDIVQYMVPKFKEKDSDITPIYEAISAHELKSEMRNKIEEMDNFLIQIKSIINNKNTEENKKLTKKNNKQ